MNAAEHDGLAGVMRHTRTLLLDFDGPLCRVFAHYRAADIADQLRDVVRRASHAVPATMSDESDPLQVLRWTATLTDPVLTEAAARELRNAELTAVESATPAPGGTAVLEGLRSTGRQAVIVSNNSQEAVAAYLGMHGLTGLIRAIVGRHDGMNPRRLKPDPYLISVALTWSETPAAAAVMVGDSVADIEAARAAGITAVGLANKPHKRRDLSDAGATTVLSEMSELADAIARAGQVV